MGTYIIAGIAGGVFSFVGDLWGYSAGASTELVAAFKAMGRWSEQTATLKVTGGNQGAEGEWGTSKSLQKSTCRHRGRAVGHAPAHAACAANLSQNPGIRALGHAWNAWYSVHLDNADPKGWFSGSGWSGKGASSNEADTIRITQDRGQIRPFNFVCERRSRNPYSSTWVGGELGRLGAHLSCYMDAPGAAQEPCEGRGHQDRLLAAMPPAGPYGPVGLRGGGCGGGASLRKAMDLPLQG
jgi:hypothetical protein